MEFLVLDMGFMQAYLFNQWLEYLQKHIHASNENQILLTLDNHASHVMLAGVESTIEPITFIY